MDKLNASVGTYQMAVQDGQKKRIPGGDGSPSIDPKKAAEISKGVNESGSEDPIVKKIKSLFGS